MKVFIQRLYGYDADPKNDCDEDHRDKDRDDGDEER